jgi:pimeloyl-ACP methyl ester carboxylesterase
MLTTSQRSVTAPAPKRRRAAWRRGTVELDGIALATFEAGCSEIDAPTIVLVHGLGHWTQAAWDFLAAELESTHRLIAFDLPGFGASAKPATGYSLGFFVRALERVVAACGLTSFALVGHSLGGLVAAEFARRRHGGELRLLGLIDPAGFLRTPRLALRIAGSRPLTWLPRTIRPTPRFVRRTLESAVYDPDSIPEDVYLRACELSRDPALTRAFALVYAGALGDFVHRGRLHARLAEWKGPTAIVWGRDDRYIPIRALANARRIYPHATVTVLERCGHCPSIEYPADVARILTKAGA